MIPFLLKIERETPDVPTLTVELTSSISLLTTIISQVVYQIVDLDLPETAPTTKYNNENHYFDKIAVYSLFSIEGDEVNRLEKALTQEENTDDTCSIQDLTQFEDKTLRDVYEHHLQAAEAKKLMPTLFVVVHNTEYEKYGVLLVDLLVDEDGNVGKVRQSVSDVLLSAVSLQIGNIGFDELEDFEPVRDKDTSGRTLPSVTYGIYGAKHEINMSAAHELVEPGCHDDDFKWREFWTCKVVASHTQGTDPIRDNAKMHPFHCTADEKMHRNWFICVDNLDPANEGVLLVHLKWDGNVNRSLDELRQIGSTAEIETERCDIDKALEILKVKKDESTAKPASMQFGVYGMKGGAPLLPTIDLVEPDNRKKDLADWLSCPMATYDKTDDSLKEILEWHPFHCYQQPQMHRQWFIGIDNDAPSKNGVLLVHMKWDGNTEREELLEIGPAAEFETERCEVGEALEILTRRVSH